MSDAQPLIANLPTPPSPIIDEAGIHLPVFNDYLTYLVTCYRSIYGVDTYLANDSQDGQMLSIFSLALSDQAAACGAAYNAYSPATAQGAGLSSNVKINGIIRKAASYSTVEVRLVGVANTEITDGVVSDNTQKWLLPSTVIIPDAGEITVTAVAEKLGAIRQQANTITRIETPTAGWQSVNNPSMSTVGQPIETDALLRRRQTVSTALPSVAEVDGLIGAIYAVSGVARLRLYENDNGAYLPGNIPGHSVTLVIEGGNDVDIAHTIAVKKPAGTGTYGSTVVSMVDNYGVPHNIKFFRPTYVAINVYISIRHLIGYSTRVGDQIIATVIKAINNINIGDNVMVARLYVPAQLVGQYATPEVSTDPVTFELLSVAVSLDRDTPTPWSDVQIAFNESAVCDVAHVTLNVR